MAGAGWARLLADPSNPKLWKMMFLWKMLGDFSFVGGYKYLQIIDSKTANLRNLNTHPQIINENIFGA